MAGLRTLLPHRRLWSRQVADTGDLLTGFTTDSARVEETHDLSHKPGSRCDRGARQEDARPSRHGHCRQCGLRRRAIRHSLFGGSGGFMAELRADPRRALRYVFRRRSRQSIAVAKARLIGAGRGEARRRFWRLWARGRPPAVCQVPSIDQGGTSARHTSHIHANRGAIFVCALSHIWSIRKLPSWSSWCSFPRKTARICNITAGHRAPQEPTSLRECWGNVRRPSSALPVFRGKLVQM